MTKEIVTPTIKGYQPNIKLSYKNNRKALTKFLHQKYKAEIRQEHAWLYHKITLGVIIGLPLIVLVAFIFGGIHPMLIFVASGLYILRILVIILFYVTHWVEGGIWAQMKLYRFFLRYRTDLLFEEQLDAALQKILLFEKRLIQLKAQHMELTTLLDHGDHELKQSFLGESKELQLQIHAYQAALGFYQKYETLVFSLKKRRMVRDVLSEGKKVQKFDYIAELRRLKGIYKNMEKMNDKSPDWALYKQQFSEAQNMLSMKTQ